MGCVEKGMGTCFLMNLVPLLQDEKSSGDWLYNNVNTLNTTKLYT